MQTVIQYMLRTLHTVCERVINYDGIPPRKSKNAEAKIDKVQNIQNIQSIQKSKNPKIQNPKIQKSKNPKIQNPEILQSIQRVQY